VWRWTGFVVLALSLCGCNRYVTIHAMDLPRVTAVGAPHWVWNDRGEAVEISGDFDAIVRTRWGKYEFSRPVRAEFVRGALVVSGSAEDATAFPLAEVHDVQLKQFSAGRTIALVLSVVGGATVLVLFFAGEVGH
jgi:hypothetical protein